MVGAVDRSSIIWRGIVLLLLSFTAVVFRLGVLRIYDIASLIACIALALQTVMLWVILRWKD